MVDRKPISYSNPPITNVIISLVYNDIEGVKQTDLCAIADELGKLGYPTVGEEPPVTTFTEPVDLFSPPLIIDSPKPPPQLPPLRGLILSASGSDWHLRFQDSRMSIEWSRQNEPYPRFIEVKHRFLVAVNVFEKVLDSRGFSVRSLKQLEISYFNGIAGSKLNDILNFVQPIGNVGAVSDIKFVPYWESLRYVYDISQPVTDAARLYFDCFPLKEGRLNTRIAFFARLVNSERSHLDAVLEIGHSAINTWFENVTRSDLQVSQWGKDVS